MTIHEVTRPFQRWIFVSYSHQDEAWAQRLRAHLNPLEKSCGARIFIDLQLDTGDDWDKRIEQYLLDANAAVLLISADFLASKYISTNEFPRLLARAKEDRGDLNVFPVFVRPCCIEEVSFEYISNEPATKGRKERRSLSSVMGANDPHSPLICQSPCQQEMSLAKVAREIAAWFRELDHAPVGPKPMLPGTSGRVDVSRMPRSANFFKGREHEIQMLQTCFEEKTTAVCTIVAQGGEGKSALVSQWLRQLERRDWHAARAFAWSFYSQGTREVSASADEFMFEALAFFGESLPHRGTPEAKGERLAQLVQQTKSVLILDGLEPLQDASGTIEDVAVAKLIATLEQNALENNLCVITTRRDVANLHEAVATSSNVGPANKVSPKRQSEHRASIPLMPLSQYDGSRLLRQIGVSGSQRTLGYLSSEVHGHPLSLLLMGTYLRDTEDAGSSETSDRLRPLDTSMSAHVQLRIRAYERYFDDQPHRDVLRLLGLFDRPVTAGEIAALKAAHIEHLTDRISSLSDAAEWSSIQCRLRRAGLINEATLENPDGLDAHPLVREYFAHRLRNDCTAAWTKGHATLYAYLSNRGEDERLPETLPELRRYYQAMHHAALGKRLEEALRDVYRPIIQRGHLGFSHRQFGAFQSELNMLRSCFNRPWTELCEGLSPFWNAHLIGLAGARLRALGKLEAAVAPLRRSKELHINCKHTLYAGIRARHLCELHVELGKLNEAETFGKEAVEKANNFTTKEYDDYRGAAIKVNRNLDLNERARDTKYQRIVAHCVLGAALHQKGKMDKAGECFAKACAAVSAEPAWEHIESPFSLWGFRYCEYLIDAVRRAPNAARRKTLLVVLNKQVNAMRTLTSMREHLEKIVPEGDLGLLGPSLVDLVEIQADFLARRSQSREELIERAKAVSQELRKGKRRDFIPLGILNYVQLVRLHAQTFRNGSERTAKDETRLHEAQQQLKNAAAIAEACKMALYQVDCQIELAWFSLLFGDRKAAVEFYVEAKEAIKHLDYGRRIPDLDDLRKALGIPKPRKKS